MIESEILRASHQLGYTLSIIIRLLRSGLVLSGKKAIGGAGALFPLI